MLGDLAAVCAEQTARIKQALLGACGAAGLDGAEAILAASGTDTEFCALHFALCDPERPVVNLVIAPDETGSGVVLAAGGRHFGSRTPAGSAVEAEAALAGLAAERVRVVTVAARDGQGDLRPLNDLGEELARLVDEAVAGGARCLLHLLDSAKTGWRAPDLDTVRRLSVRHGADLDVVVDACQLRAGPKRLRSYLDDGFMVQVTGSKFCTGPAFSARHRDLAPLPAGLADYATRGEWPDGWEHICQGLPERPNLGLLCRWTAALTELRALQAVPEEQVRQILETFAQAVQAAIAERPMLALVPGQAEYGGGAAVGGWDRLATIFPFTVRRADAEAGQAVLSLEQAKTVYQWLNTDLSGLAAGRGLRGRAGARGAALPYRPAGQALREGQLDGRPAALRRRAPGQPGELRCEPGRDAGRAPAAADRRCPPGARQGRAHRRALGRPRRGRRATRLIVTLGAA